MKQPVEKKLKLLINSLVNNLAVLLLLCLGLERLHEARLERERIIGEYQLQQETRPHKKKQQDINAAASTTVPKSSPMRTQYYSQKKQVVPQEVVTPTREKLGVTSASLPLSEANIPEFSATMMSLPERVSSKMQWE